MKVSYLESLPDDYRFQKEDIDRSWQILMETVFASDESERDWTEAEEDFCWTIHAVERVAARLGFMPTKQGLLAELEKERKEAEREKQKWKRNT